MSTADVVTVFLAGAQIVAQAIADPAVAQAWDRPSVLEDQLVSSLAGHLARGGVWVVADYLDRGRPSGPVDFDSTGEYFASCLDTASEDTHQGIRDRGAAVAAVGQEELVRQLNERLHLLEPRLRSLDAADLVAVVAGKVMRVGDYLVTRVVEQVVHLDDLARSIGREPWPYPLTGQDLVIEVGVDIARRRSGRASLLRALYRRGFAEATLPVL
ncbi:MAG TPA: maleylpyruvate isomerase N-terminal domain-containing protein [Acidimicrobiales bacterium]|nr:maleylpyruvate isomerase N-terminal domain-containing protein [Acidimicrobiales bacterium]